MRVAAAPPLRHSRRFPMPWSQIQAGTPTVIQLASGTYSEASGERFPLRLKSGVTLLGNEQVKGKDYTIIGSGEVVSPTFARQNVTILTANNSGCPRRDGQKSGQPRDGDLGRIDQPHDPE